MAPLFPSVLCWPKMRQDTNIPNWTLNGQISTIYSHFLSTEELKHILVPLINSWTNWWTQSVQCVILTVYFQNLLWWISQCPKNPPVYIFLQWWWVVKSLPFLYMDSCQSLGQGDLSHSHCADGSNGLSKWRIKTQPAIQPAVLQTILKHTWTSKIPQI